MALENGCSIFEIPIGAEEDSQKTRENIFQKRGCSFGARAITQWVGHLLVLQTVGPDSVLGITCLWFTEHMFARSSELKVSSKHSWV